MKTRIILSGGLFLLLAVLLAGSVQAMSSATYRLDWFTPLTTGGGGISTSPGYTVNITVGQSVTGAASSATYKIALGYWAGAAGPNYIYLPLILMQP